MRLSAQALYCAAALQKGACVCVQVSSERLCARMTCVAHLQMSLEPLRSRNLAPASCLPSQEQAELAAQLTAELGALQIPSPALDHLLSQTCMRVRGMAVAHKLSHSAIRF